MYVCMYLSMHVCMFVCMYTCTYSGFPMFRILPHRSANVIRKIQFKLSCERALSTGEPFTYKYVTLFQPFQRGTLSTQWCITQKFLPTFFMSVLFTCSPKAAMFSRFLKIAIAMSNFMNEVYNSEFLPKFSVSILKEIIALVWDSVHGTRK